MKELIADTFVFESSKFEDVSTSKKGVLRTIKGPLAEWDNLNRNGRKYSERLWDRVLESPYVNEQMEYKTLYGEANHPQGRYEVDFERVSHSIVEMHKDSKDKTLYGTIDILDTPLGRILNVLYEYGSVLGVSSRAGGVLNKKKDYIEVDEDSYHFITFDMVPYPSVARARLVSEGVVEDSTDKMEISEEAHKKLLSIIENCSQKDKEILKSFIYSLRDYNLDKEIMVIEGIAGGAESSSSDSSLKDTTLCLLKESYQLNSKLKDKNTELNTKASKLEESLKNLTKAKSELETLSEGLRNNIVTLANEKSKYKLESEAANTELTKLRNTISLDEENSLDKELLESEIKKAESENKSLKLALKKVNEELGVTKKNRDELNTRLLESEANAEKLKSRVDESIDYEDVVAELGKAVIEISNLNIQIKESAAELDNLRKGKEEIENLRNKVSVLESEKRQRTKELKELNESSLAKANEVDNTKKSFAKELTSVTESYESTLKTYKKELISTICSKYGVNESLVIDKLGKDFTAGDIHIVCEGLVTKTNPNLIIEAESTTTTMKDDKKKARLDSLLEGSRRG